MIQELRYAARLLLKSPGFTSVAIASLALGIGVNTAVLGVAHAVLLEPLRVRAPHELRVAYWHAEGARGLSNINSSSVPDPATGRNMSSNYTYQAFEALREAVRGSADVFAFTFMRQANVFAGDLPVAAAGMLVSGNYFRVLGPPLVAGRAIEARDDRAGAELVAVIDHGLWRRAFGGDPGVVGQRIRINGHSFAIVGVTGPGYFGVSNGGFFPPAEITVPLSAQPLLYPRWTPAGGSIFSAPQVFWLRVMVRVPGERGADRLPQLERVMSQTLANHFASVSPGLAIAQPTVALLPGERGLDSMREDFERPLYMLAAVAALVLLIACVNLANLVLVRGLARQYEFRVRLALGAGRARLVRQTVAESLLLSTLGGAAGAWLAVWGGRALAATIAGSTPHAIDVALDVRLLASAAAISAVAALLFGLLPALRVSRTDASDLVRQSGAGAAAPRLRAGRALILVQVAVSVPLLAGAAVFLRTVHNLSVVELGFEPSGVVIFRLDPGLNGYPEDRVKALYVNVLDRLQAIPGVRSATLLENALVSGWISSNRITLEDDKQHGIQMNRVGPGFFDTMGVQIVAGRGLGVQDTVGAPPVAVINETAAQRLFGGTNPLGRSFTFGPRRERVEIVGVARDSKYDSLKKETQPLTLLPFLQSRGLSAMFVAVRTPVSSAMLDRIRGAVAEIDPDVPVTEMKTQTAQIAESIGRERAVATLLTTFGGFALLLACIGLHGVTAYSVARRTSEIGIRMALGAQRRDIIWMIVRQVLLLAAAGLVIGIPTAAAASRSIRAWLYGIEPDDPLSLGAAAVTLLFMALAAAFVPARSASRLDPLRALRHE
jgi:predicted permease